MFSTAELKFNTVEHTFNDAEPNFLFIVYQFLLLSLHKITTSGCGIRPTTH